MPIFITEVCSIVRTYIIGHKLTFLIYTKNLQPEFSVNVWCRLLGSIIIGPVFYQGVLIDRDLIISGALEEYLHDVPSQIRLLIYYQRWRTVPSI